MAVLISNELWPSILNVDARKDEIWFGLSFLPGLSLGAIYISPNDSQFYSEQPFATIQEKALQGNKLLVMGDLNARMGDLSSFANVDKCVTYESNSDHTTNYNGNVLKNICAIVGMLPLNHASVGNRNFDGTLTFKKKDNWVSQLDWCLVSETLTDNIMNFIILKDTPLKSDHAALETVLICNDFHLDLVESSARILGSYPTCENICGSRNIKFTDINSQLFTNG